MALLSRKIAEGGPFVLVELGELLTTEFFVALFDLRRSLRLYAAEGLKQFGWIEGLNQVVGVGTTIEARRCDHDDGDLWLKLFDFSGDFVARYVVEAAVEHDATDGRKSGEDVQGLLAAVRRYNVEFCGFDHQLAGRDAAGELSVDD